MTRSAERDGDTTPWAERDAHWARLRDAPLDGLGDTALAARIADLGAPDPLLEEYRRFLRLAEMFPEEVCPPPVVAQIWMMHDGTAGAKALGIVRDPAAGQGDLPHCLPRYLKTRKAYTRYFGEAPPEAIWTPPAKPAPARPARSGVAAAILLVMVALLLPEGSALFRALLIVVAGLIVLRSARHLLAQREAGE